MAQTLALIALLITTAPVGEMLDGGRVRFTPPTDWRFVTKTADDFGAVYAKDDLATLTILVTPQPAALQPQHAPQMGRHLVRRIRENIQEKGGELLVARVEPDDRYFLTIHDRTRMGERIEDRLQIYRLIGMNLVSVSVVVATDSPLADDLHDVGRELLSGVRAGRGPSPIAFPRTGVRLFPPADWQAQRKDDPNGLVARFDPPPEHNSPLRIEVHARVLAKDAGEAQRNQRVEQILEAMTAQAVVDRNDPNLLRSVRFEKVEEDQPLLAHVRFVQVGDVVVGLCVMGPADSEAQIVRHADQMAGKVERLPGRGGSR
jgi:hypothetical protein